MASPQRVDEMESRIGWDAAAAADEAERQQAAAHLPMGTRVIDAPDPDYCPELRTGVIVEATADELVRGADECCTFDPGRTWVLVEWTYPEIQGGGVERAWESPHQLAVAPPGGEFPAQDCEFPLCPDRPHKVGPWTR